MKINRLKKSLSFGLTLIELMVATFLGALLLLCAIKLFLTFNKTWVFNQGISRLQENGRSAIEFLNADIRSAGYVGCGKLENLSIINDTKLKNMLTPNSLIQGYIKGRTTGLPNNIKKKIKTNTDVIVIEKASNQVARVLRYSSASKELKIVGKPLFKKNQYVFIADCKQGEVVQIENVKGSPPKQMLTLKKRLKNTFTRTARVYHLQKIVYYIDKKSALHRKNLLESPRIPDELMKGVEDMQIRYGIDAKQSGHVTKYATAEKVNNWQDVVSVQLALLLDSIVQINNAASRYQFLGKSYANNDRLLHKEWDTYIALRNRISHQ